jgi:hypothetical protein
MYVLITIIGTLFGFVLGYMLGSHVMAKEALKIVNEVLSIDGEMGYDEEYWWNNGDKPEEV